MAKFVWCWPIRSGKTQIYQNRFTELHSNDSEQQRMREEMNDRCGVHEYATWVQHLPNQDLYLNFIDCEDWHQVWTGFRTLVNEGHELAIEINDLWKQTLGLDMTQEEAITQPEILAEFEWGKLPAKDVVRVAFAFPILEGHEENRREFTRACHDKYRQEFDEMCRDIGLIGLSRYLMETDHGTYYVVMEETSTEHWPRLQQFLHTSMTSKKTPSWVWKGLSRDTGLSREQLEPHLEWVSHKPPATVTR